MCGKWQFVGSSVDARGDNKAVFSSYNRLWWRWLSRCRSRNGANRDIHKSNLSPRKKKTWELVFVPRRVPQGLAAELQRSAVQVQTVASPLSRHSWVPCIQQARRRTTEKNEKIWIKKVLLFFRESKRKVFILFFCKLRLWKGKGRDKVRDFSKIWADRLGINWTIFLGGNWRKMR